MAIDTRLRGSGAGMRRAATDLAEAARQYGEICERPNEFFALTHLAAAYRLLGKADSALATYRRARLVAARLAPLDTIADMRTFRHVIGGPATARATIDHYIGDVYRDLGRPDSAIVHYRRGEGFVRNEFDVNLQELDDSDPDSDATAARRSNRNARTQPHATLASIADAFRDMGRPDSALAYYRRAMILARSDSTAVRMHFVGYGELNMHEARYHIGMGAAFIDAGQPDSALASFRRAQALARNWPLGQWAQRRARIDVLDGIGRAQAMLGRADSALAVHAEALAQSRRLSDAWGETRALHALGRLHHRERAPRELTLAVAYYDSAATAFATLSGFAGGDANRVTVAERGKMLVEDWAMAVLAQDAAGSIAPAVAALAAVERGRAQALLRLIGGEGNARAAGAPQSLAAEGTRLVDALRRSGTTTLSYLVASDTVVAWLTLPDGVVEVHRAAVSRDSIGTLVETVRAGLDVDDAATRGRLASPALLPDANAVTAATGSTRARLIARGDTTAALAAARVLSSVLMPPAWIARVDSAAELVVVPHGPLALVPFAALPLGRSGEGDGMASGWGSRFAVRQAPSLTTLVEVEARHASAPDPASRRFTDALIVGNPAMPQVRGDDGLSELLPALPQAGAEARGIGDRLGVAALTGSAATERAIRARLPQARIVHLATHGFAFASDARARESFIALASDSTHDGLLTVAEIMDDPALRLATELVVLSACQSGLGDLKDAEGTIGLPRAFLARGARSVLVSLWNVSDDATRLLMDRFYAHWLDDADRPSKARALQRAATDVRNTDGFEHPRYWAGFQVVGGG